MQVKKIETALEILDSEKNAAGVDFLLTTKGVRSLKEQTQKPLQSFLRKELQPRSLLLLLLLLVPLVVRQSVPTAKRLKT